MTDSVVRLVVEVRSSTAPPGWAEQVRATIERRIELAFGPWATVTPDDRIPRGEWISRTQPFEPPVGWHRYSSLPAPDQAHGGDALIDACHGFGGPGGFYWADSGAIL